MCCFIKLALILWCAEAASFYRQILAAENLKLARFLSAVTPPVHVVIPNSTPSSLRQPPHWSLCSVRIWTQPPLLCGPETQAGPFVPPDKRKKGGHGRRINLSPAQTTHLLVVLISCLSLLWFLLLFFLLSLVRAKDIGSGCTVNPQSRDTSLPPFLFFPSSGYSRTQWPLFLLASVQKQQH